MGRRTGFILILSLFFHVLHAQDYRWQQRAEYTMDVKLDISAHKVTGTQRLVYYNNSKDTLRKVFYHLYFNAFQPGSMMDVRSLNIEDPDKRVMDRISKLSSEETGYQHILQLTQDGKEVSSRVEGTILEVILPKPILPNSKTTFDMKFEAQIPLQVRRSGRNNKEGIAYSMTQWYPKMAEYDHQGWHAYQYVAREFHGVWGDFDVKITVDPSYVVAGTGELQNPDKIGHGYEEPGTAVKRPEGDLTWHFVAKNVHDFAWAADTDYTHQIVNVQDGLKIHFFYQKGDKTTHWTQLPQIAANVFRFFNERFGKYPYSTYSVIQGGDGGMEYPMCTLILGEGTLAGTAETMIHEIAHSWFQMALASNEALYAWMDEGFASFAEAEAMISLFDLKEDIYAATYRNYTQFIATGKEEPPSQHSDFFSVNKAYTTASYIKGAILLRQLKYIMGEKNFWKAMKRYYDAWKFRHPEPNDFLRIMEKTSGLQLKWFFNYWINTTKQIDYSFQKVIENNGATFVTLERTREMPMPIDLLVTYKDGSKELFYIPLNEMLGSKPAEDETVIRTELDPWPWVYPTYILKINRASENIATMEIDPTGRLADVNPKNNRIDVSKGLKAFESRQP